MKSIIFNTKDVRATLDNRKTATRRVVKGAPNRDDLEPYTSPIGNFGLITPNSRLYYIKPPYRPDDILYVRETWYYESHMEDVTAGEPDLPSGRYSHRYIFKADCPDYPVNVGVGQHGWRPSIHMPREAARIFLHVTDVRVEKLQSITMGDMLKEGIIPHHVTGGQWQQWQSDCMKPIWNSHIKPADRALYGWEANPYVWCVSFEKISKEEAQQHE